MLELYEGLRGWISGPAVPTFIVDGLGGLGKLPIIPSYVREETLPDGSGTTITVSYTHLDVYKRQEQEFMLNPAAGGNKAVDRAGK